MILNYYGLKEQPFGVSPDPRFLYESPTHVEARASLQYGVEVGRGFMALVARPGMGKTTLLFDILNHYRETARTVFLFRTKCTPQEFLRYLLSDLGFDVRGRDSVFLHEMLHELLVSEARSGKRVLLVIDEAQNLDESVLESVRLLSDFETPSAKLMQIILAGQPQLAHTLARPSLLQFRQRISMLARLKPLSPTEVACFIDHRLQVAGYSGPQLFTAEAYQMIADHSQGIPRNINNICFHALSLGYVSKSLPISKGVIREAVHDVNIDALLEDEPVLADPPASPRTAHRKSSSNPSKTSPPVAVAVSKDPEAADAPAIPLTALSTGQDNRQHFRDLKVVVPAILLLLAIWMTVSFRSSASSPSIASVPSQAAVPISSIATPRTAPSNSDGPSESKNSKAVTNYQGASRSFAVIVRPGQSISQLSIDRLGHYGPQTLQEIRELNPWLRNPDMVEVGREVRFPQEDAKSKDWKPTNENMKTSKTTN
ncbi:MAG: ExeA family protein [Candidatus Acidiferrales bacterium]